MVQHPGVDFELCPCGILYVHVFGDTSQESLNPQKCLIEAHRYSYVLRGYRHAEKISKSRSVAEIKRDTSLK